MVYKCYECNPGPCEVGPTKEVPFKDGAVVTMFERSGQMHLTDTSSIPFTFGLTSAYTYTPGYSTPHAGLGLGLKRKPRRSFDTFIDQLLSQRLIGSPAFSIYLKTAGSRSTGQLILGGEDPSMYKAPMAFLPIKGKDRVEMTGLRVGDSSYSKRPLLADVLFDTGGNGILLPEESYESVIHDLKFNGQKRIGIAKFRGMYCVRCDDKEYLPPITFYIKAMDGKDVPLTIQPQNYVSSIAQTELRLCSILIGSDSTGKAIIGDMALVGHYFYYKWEENKIGFAELS